MISLRAKLLYADLPDLLWLPWVQEGYLTSRSVRELLPEMIPRQHLPGARAEARTLLWAKLR